MYYKHKHAHTHIYFLKKSIRSSHPFSRYVQRYTISFKTRVYNLFTVFKEKMTEKKTTQHNKHFLHFPLDFPHYIFYCTSMLLFMLNSLTREPEVLPGMPLFVIAPFPMRISFFSSFSIYRRRRHEGD